MACRGRVRSGARVTFAYLCNVFVQFENGVFVKASIFWHSQKQAKENHCLFIHFPIFHEAGMTAPHFHRCLAFSGGFCMMLFTG